MPGPNQTIRSQKIVSIALDSDTVLDAVTNLFPDGKWYMTGQELIDIATPLGEFDRVTLRRIGGFMDADALGYEVINGESPFSGTLAAATAAIADPDRGEMEANISGLGPTASNAQMQLCLYNEGKETPVTPIVVNWDDLVFSFPSGQGDVYKVVLTDAIPTAVGTNRGIGRVAITDITLDSLADSPNTQFQTFQVNSAKPGGVRNRLIGTHFTNGQPIRRQVGTNEFTRDLVIEVTVNGTIAPTSGSFTVGFSEFEGADAPVGNEALFVRAFIEQQA